MHKALHPRDDVDRLYVSRKEGGRGLASIEDSVDTSIQRLEDYIQRRLEDYIQKRQEDQLNDNNQKNKSGKKNNSMDAVSD